MYRLLIVEDEKWEREGLRDFLNWSSLGIEVSGCACNGAEGLKMAELYRPEIILTDIMMPKLDGIRMSQDIRIFLPETKIIILSGYDDFQFAKQTFGFHAFGYVLKPVGKKNLEDVICSVIKVLDREKSRNSEREALERQWADYAGKNGDRLLLDLLEGKIELEYVNKLMPISELDLKGKKVTAILSLFFNPDRTGPGAVAGRSETEIMNAFGSMLDQKGIVFSFIKPLKEAVICIDAPDTHTELEQQLLLLRDSFFNELGVKTIIGVGAVAENFAAAPQSYTQAREAYSFRFLAEYGELLFYDKIKEAGLRRMNQTELLIRKTDSIAKKIAYGIQKGNINECARLLEDFLSALRENLPMGKLLLGSFFTEVGGCLSGVINEAVLNKIGTVSLEAFDSLTHTKCCIMDFLREIAMPLQDNRSPYEDVIVNKIIEIIEGKYTRDLDLKLLSEEIHLSPYYIGTIFKRHTGKVFSQYLNDFRIEMAKEILQSEKIKVSHLARTVGIRNSSYFCSLFKNRFGISPGEYKDMLKGRRDRV